MTSNAQILMQAFGSNWGRGKPPNVGDALHADAELLAPDSLPYGGGVFEGRDRVLRWFAEDLWEMWAEFSSTPTDLIDGGDKIVVPVHVNAKTHDGIEVQAENVWIFEFVGGQCDAPACTPTPRRSVTLWSVVELLSKRRRGGVFPTVTQITGSGPGCSLS